MIQTEKHGMIEPRVGDVVDTHLDGLPPLKVRGFHGTKIVDNFGDRIESSHCTLLHRPDAPEYDHSEWEG